MTSRNAAKKKRFTKVMEYMQEKMEHQLQEKKKKSAPQPYYYILVIMAS